MKRFVVSQASTIADDPKEIVRTVIEYGGGLQEFAVLVPHGYVGTNFQRTDPLLDTQATVYGVNDVGLIFNVADKVAVFWEKGQTTGTINSIAGSGIINITVDRTSPGDGFPVSGTPVTINKNYDFNPVDNILAINTGLASYSPVPAFINFVNVLGPTVVLKHWIRKAGGVVWISSLATDPTGAVDLSGFQFFNSSPLAQEMRVSVLQPTGVNTRPI